jgi:hypothetical protein
MAATCTVTGVTGAAITVTAGVYSNVSKVEFTCGEPNNIIAMTDSGGYINRVSINAATTITATKSGSTYTFVVS